MGSYVTTLATILAVELTDKTRLIALLLSSRYRAPGQLMLGMTLGYVPAAALAVWSAGLVTQVIPYPVMRWLLAGSFMGFGASLLLYRADDDETLHTER